MEYLTQNRLKFHFNYNPRTGLFFRNSTGLKVGIKRKDGYIVIRIGGKMYRAHRLAWLFMTGEWPKNEIDHINCIRDDNRFVNLREASKSQNSRNTGLRITNKSGYTGVRELRGKFYSYVKLNNKYVYLGKFNTAIEASERYQSIIKQNFGKFWRDPSLPLRRYPKG